MAILRCEECGAKLYDDDDECPKCGAAVDDRPRSKKRDDDDRWDPEDDRPKAKSRRDDDEEDDRPRPAKKSRRDDDDEDDRPRKTSRRDDDEDDDERPRKRVSRDDNDDERPVRKSRRDDDDEDDRRPPKRGSGDFEIVDDEDDDDAPPKKKPSTPPLPTPSKAVPPPPPPVGKKPAAEAPKPEPAPTKKPELKKPEPVATKKPEPAPAKKPVNADFEIEDGEAEPPKAKKSEPPKAEPKKSPPPPATKAAVDTHPATKKPAPVDGEEGDDTPSSRSRDRDDDNAPRPAKKTRSFDEPLKVSRWSGLFLWTILLGFFGPILLGLGYFLVTQAKETKSMSYQFDSPGVKGTGSFAYGSFTYTERNDTKGYAGVVLATVGGTSICLAYGLFYLWLYRAWRLIPKEYGGLNPFVALLLLMTPGVNLIGIFLVIPGLSKALQRVLEELEPDEPAKAGAKVGKLACIFLFVPVLNMLSGLLFLAWFDQANYARNRIIALQEASA